MLQRGLLQLSALEEAQRDENTYSHISIQTLLIDVRSTSCSGSAEHIQIIWALEQSSHRKSQDKSIRESLQLCFKVRQPLVARVTKWLRNICRVVTFRLDWIGGRKQNNYWFLGRLFFCQSSSKAKFDQVIFCVILLTDNKQTRQTSKKTQKKPKRKLQTAVMSLKSFHRLSA